jgi:hypothetical protein
MGCCCSADRDTRHQHLPDEAIDLPPLPAVVTQISSGFNPDFRPKRKPESERLLTDPEIPPQDAGQDPSKGRESDSADSIDRDMIRDLLQEVVLSDSSN